MIRKNIKQKYIDSFDKSMSENTSKNRPLYCDNVNSLKDTIVKASVTLLKDHNIKQKEIFNWIREGLKEYSTQFPKTRVLYNTTYGGYGLSKQFISFCKTSKYLRSSHADKENRVMYVDYIVPFAKHIFELPHYNCRTLFDILYLHEHYELSDVFYFANMYIKKEKEKTYLEENIKKIKVYLENPTSTYINIEAKKKTFPDYHYYKPTHTFFTSENVNLSNYYREDLEEFISKDNSIVDMENDIQLFKKIILSVIPEHVFIDILSYIKDIYDEFKQETTQSLYTYYTSLNKDYKTFIELLKKEGYDSYKTWYSQTKFNEVAIHYLIYVYKQKSHSSSCGTYTNVFDFLVTQESIKVDDEICEQVFLNFGLLCASSAYCELGIDEVPTMVDWSIGEYDGKESIYIV